MKGGNAAFENNVFTQLSQNAQEAARQIYRLLKPGGFFAARDVDVDSVVWGHRTDPIKELDRLFIAWHLSRGSDITIGKRLPTILREAGFIYTIKLEAGFVNRQAVKGDSRGKSPEKSGRKSIDSSLKIS